MKIKIIKNEGIYNDQNVVSFSSAFACGKASWNGETPIEGRARNTRCSSVEKRC